MDRSRTSRPKFPNAWNSKTLKSREDPRVEKEWSFAHFPQRQRDRLSANEDERGEADAFERREDLVLRLDFPRERSQQHRYRVLWEVQRRERHVGIERGMFLRRAHACCLELGLDCGGCERRDVQPFRALRHAEHREHHDDDDSDRLRSELVTVAWSGSLTPEHVRERQRNE